MNTEIPGIAIILETDTLSEKDDDHFNSKPYLIPDLGHIYLYGDRVQDYSDFREGITVTNGELAIRESDELREMGLYDMDIHIRTFRETTSTMICSLYLPLNYGMLKLSNEMVLDTDIAEAEFNPEGRYELLTVLWKFFDRGHDYPFFVPADPKFLSQLRFSLSSILPEKQL